jgi:hypothetical protein
MLCCRIPGRWSPTAALHDKITIYMKPHKCWSTEDRQLTGQLKGKWEERWWRLWCEVQIKNKGLGEIYKIMRNPVCKLRPPQIDITKGKTTWQYEARSNDQVSFCFWIIPTILSEIFCSLDCTATATACSYWSIFWTRQGSRCLVRILGKYIQWAVY